MLLIHKILPTDQFTNSKGSLLKMYPTSLNLSNLKSPDYLSQKPESRTVQWVECPEWRLSEGGLRKLSPNFTKKNTAERLNGFSIVNKADRWDSALIYTSIFFPPYSKGGSGWGWGCEGNQTILIFLFITVKKQ